MSHWQIRISALLLLSLVAIESPSSSAAIYVKSELKADAGLSTLPVKGRAPKTGYSRAEFGPAWSDVDRNGCDTRNDILKRDLTDLVFRQGTYNCIVESGTLVDRYSGEIIYFTRGVATSSEVQIDHVVALSNAWQTGAFKLTPEGRKQMANDPLNLLAVKGRLNSQKGDGDAATWLPPKRSFWCSYVAHQIAVKVKYKLWVTKPEKAQMVRILATCPAQKLPTN
jgi:hypothetical protein